MRGALQVSGRLHFRYVWLEEENQRRRQNAIPEFELADTGVFNENRYFDVFAVPKASPNDILIRIAVANRGPRSSDAALLPTTWFCNQWSWDTRRRRNYENRSLNRTEIAFCLNHPILGRSFCKPGPDPVGPTSETAVH